MEHPDWPSLIAAIVADPDDDTVRLVAADFLEENGDPDRAAFIRIQIELARLEAEGQGKSLEVDHLRAKERSFLGPLSVYRRLWSAEACPELVKMPSRGSGRDPLEGMTVEGAERLMWRRGFVEGVTCSAEQWSRHGAAVRQRNPIRDLSLTHPGELTRTHWYAMMPALLGLRKLCINDDSGSLVEWLRGWLPGVDVFWIPW
jgi:uncharacterized protein (TIGR02996 family)